MRSALDTFEEAIVVVDDKNRIMMVNGRLPELLGGRPDEYQGRQLESLSWDKRSLQLLAPHADAGTDDSSSKVLLVDQAGEERFFKLNQSAIVDDDGKQRGRLLSFDDITVIEKQQEQLQNTLEELQTSQAEIAKQNEKLQYLATRDPMTGCYNRRSFFENFDKTWSGSFRYDHPLSCVLVDVDHFKSINDNFGHAMGDEVLKEVAAALLATARDSDVVCRYGGEEFCVLLPHVDIDGAKKAAERFRLAIADLEFKELTVTASIGCSDRMQGADSAEGMLEQADQALYKAKRGGRNQVVAFSSSWPTNEELEENAENTVEQVAETPLESAKTDIERDVFSTTSALVTADTVVQNQDSSAMPDVAAS